jgi:hypothetical protein
VLNITVGPIVLLNQLVSYGFIVVDIYNGTRVLTDRNLW